MVKSNRAAALRWLEANVGATLDTVQTDAAGAIRWIPGPRKLVKIGATRYGMEKLVPATSRRGPSQIGTDAGTASKFYVNGDTLTIVMFAGFNGRGADGNIVEIWHITHYSVRGADAFTVAHELTVARVNE